MTTEQKRLSLLMTREEVAAGVQQISENVAAQLEKQKGLLIAIEAIDEWLEKHPAPTEAKEETPAATSGPN